MNAWLSSLSWFLWPSTDSVESHSPPLSTGTTANPADFTPGVRPHVLQQLPVKSLQARQRVPAQRRVHLKRHQVVHGLKARVGLLQIGQRAHEQSGPHQQQERKATCAVTRHLAQLHRTARRRSPRPPRPSACSTNPACSDCSAGASPNSTPVSSASAALKPRMRKSGSARSISGAPSRGQEAQQAAHHGHRKQQPDCAARHRQHQAFDQQLPHQLPARRAHRQPHRHLLLPRHRPRNQQVRHVEARDQQHQPDHAHQHRSAPSRNSAAAREYPLAAASIRTFRARKRSRLYCEMSFSSFCASSSSQNLDEQRLQRSLRGLHGVTRLHAREHLDPLAAPVADIVPPRRHQRLHLDGHADLRRAAGSSPGSPPRKPPRSSSGSCSPASSAPPRSDRPRIASPNIGSSAPPRVALVNAIVLLRREHAPHRRAHAQAWK